MDKWPLLMLLFLIIISSLYIYIFFLYLYNQYKKAEATYYKEEINIKKRCLAIKEKQKNNKIKNNVTTIINSELINEKAGYAMIEFINQYGATIKTQIIRRPSLKIGRDESNDIVLRAQTVSRYQCSIICKNNTFTIYNYSKSNPTILNNVEIKDKKELFFDDVIKIANYTLRFREVIYESEPYAG